VKRLAISLLACGTLAAFAAPSASAARFHFFLSPSKNIGCVIGGGFTRCDIIKHSWPLPPEPPTCEFDYGQAFGIGKEDKPGEILCVSDSAFDAEADVLPYGDRITIHRFRCASKTKGMRCVNTKTKHGFFVSRERYRLF
jgi:hypothetical protein